MASVIKASDIQSHIDRKAAIDARKARRAAFEGIAFESLSPAQKDAALKELLIQAKLIPET